MKVEGSAKLLDCSSYWLAAFVADNPHVVHLDSEMSRPNRARVRFCYHFSCHEPAAENAEQIRIKRQTNLSTGQRDMSM